MSKLVNIVLEKYDNEELAEANELIGDLLINANIENKRLKDENAKLRELVQRALNCKTNEGCCEDCWSEYGECPIEMEMRELGIEVADE